MRSGCTAALLSGLIASTALAHPSPAEPPAFFAADCIIVVDKQAQASWHLDYAVVTDDVEAEVDHVSLDDSKTHQFFALSGTLFERATTQEIMLFDDEEGLLRAMPTWLNADDVMRAAAGVKPEDMTTFTAEQVLPGDILESDAVLSSAVRPLVNGTARVPITGDAASAGVTWDLRDVPPGIYQIAAYIFSPPYNGWVARPGLIKVVDSALDAEAHPAVALDSVAGRVFAGQGRRVRGCVDAPAGSMLEISTRSQAAAAGGFEPWIVQPTSNGDFELCLDNVGVSDALELRATIRTPGGMLAATRSSDAISLFSNAAACVESELLCCPAGATVDAGGPAVDASLPMVPMTPTGPTVVDAGASGEPVEAPRQDGSTDAMAAPTPPASSPGSTESCQCRLGRTRQSPAMLGAGVMFLALWLRRRTTPAA
jgi:hypothetical protein